MGPKLEPEKQMNPSEQLLEIRRRKAKLAKWLPGGKRNCSNRGGKREPEPDPGDQPGESAPSQPTEPGKKMTKYIN